MLINLSRVAVFVNLQQENVYLFAILKASSRTESSCKEQLASGLQSKETLVCSSLFFVPVPFLSTRFSLFLMLKIGNTYLQPEVQQVFQNKWQHRKFLFVLSNLLTP